jgi:hypothetical protein
VAKSSKPRKTPTHAPGSDPLELNPRTRGPAPEWLPDWRDKQQYVVPKHPLFLAWQFIRRNPDYWSDWRRLSALPDHTPEDLDGCDWSTGQYHPIGSIFYDMSLYQTAEGASPARKGETREQYVKRTGSVPMPIREWIEQKWGFHPLDDPSVSSKAIGRRGMFAESVPPYFGRDAVKKFEDAPWKFAIVAIDIDHSIEAQVALARQVAMASRKHFESPFGINLGNGQRKSAVNRVRARELCLYLRAYDAAWCRARDVEIVMTLNLADIRDAQRYIRKAQDYIGGEYRSLLSAI